MIEHQEIREFLLGNLPSGQQTLLEERLLTHDELYEELVIIEDELVDEYLGNELSSTDRRRFESHFLAAPEHQEKLRFAQTFRQYVAAEAPVPAEARVASSPNVEASSARWWGFLPARNPLAAYALAAAMVLLAIGATWVVWERFSTSPRNPDRVVTAVLRPGLSRGLGTQDNRVTVAGDVGTVRLQLLLPETRYAAFQATLLDIDNREVVFPATVRTEVINGQRTAVLDIPADVLSPGDHSIKLSGVDEQGNRESLATYSFRVQAP